MKREGGGEGGGLDLIFRSKESLEREEKENLLFYRDLNFIEIILLMRIDSF
jgi:hypothetical protein